VAPEGKGLYLTVVRRAAEGEPLSIVPIAVARWTAEALRDKTGIAVELKWPNDLYARRRKLAGVIAESRTQGDETYVAVGIGINVLGRSDALGVPNATTIEEETGRAHPLHVQADPVGHHRTAPRAGRRSSRLSSVAAAPSGDWDEDPPRTGEEDGRVTFGLSPAGFLRLCTEKGRPSSRTARSPNGRERNRRRRSARGRRGQHQHGPRLWNGTRAGLHWRLRAPRRDGPDEIALSVRGLRSRGRRGLSPAPCGQSSRERTVPPCGSDAAGLPADRWTASRSSSSRG
jgi:hypothetical protein